MSTYMERLTEMKNGIAEMQKPNKTFIWITGTDVVRIDQIARVECYLDDVPTVILVDGTKIAMDDLYDHDGNNLQKLPVQKLRELLTFLIERSINPPYTVEEVMTDVKFPNK